MFPKIWNNTTDLSTLLKDKKYIDRQLQNPRIDLHRKQTRQCQFQEVEKHSNDSKMLDHAINGTLIWEKSQV